MQLKRFEGTSMEEILARVRKTLGEDALILSTRRKGKKGLGAFTKTVYEVSAAVDRRAEPAPPPAPRFVPPVYRPQGLPGPAPPGEEILFTPLPPASAPPPPPAEPGSVSSGPPASGSAGSGTEPSTPAAPPFEAFLSFEREIAPLKEEIASLKEFLKSVVAEREKQPAADRKDRLDVLAREVRSLHDLLKAGVPREDRGEAASGETPGVPAPPAGDDGNDWLVRRLLAQGVRPDVTRGIRDAVVKRLGPDRRAVLEDLRREAEVVIASAVRAVGFPAPPPSAPRIIAFIGPPEAGKTESVSRAGRMLSRRGFRVAVVTVGERAADLRLLIERLQRPHGIPVLSAAGGEELSRAVATCFGAHYILVDVAGRRCADRDAVRSLAEMFRPHADIDFCLTLPAAWTGPDAPELVRSLSPLDVRYLAFTRMDRTRRFGGMVNAAVAASRPVLFLTAGDSPSGDIFPARPYMFSRLLLSSSGAPQERTHS